MAEDVIFDDVSFHRFIDSLEYPLSKENYELQLSSFKKLKKKGLPYLLNSDHLANILEVSPSQLNLFISKKRIAYSSFKLPKKRGGFREIDAPSKEMKQVQRWILDNILYRLDAGKYAHAFLHDKSVVTNASVHVNQHLVLGIDLKDFFPNITFKMVFGLFRSVGYNINICYSLTELCTFRWRIPQGAPTSPMISNLMSRRMDLKLSSFCEKRGLKYSRYADDITISGGRYLPRYKTLIFRKIEEEGFIINPSKLRLHDRGSCQRVTGLVVNDKVSIGRDRKRKLRALVHNILKNGPISENRYDDPFFKERVFGTLAFVKMVDSDFASPLIELLKGVDWNEYCQVSSGSKESEFCLRSLSRNVSNPLVPFDKLGFFKDVKEISQKDSRALLEQLDELREKCGEHSKEACRDCLYKRKGLYNKCIKYILGCYIGNTGGHHHGHELFDVGGETDLDGHKVSVGFVAKSGAMDTQAKDVLFRQFFDCMWLEELDVVSIVTPDTLDPNSKLCNRLKRVSREHSQKWYCMILRNEMLRILYHFKQKQLERSE